MYTIIKYIQWNRYKFEIFTGMGSIDSRSQAHTFFWMFKKSNGLDMKIESELK